MVGQVKEKNSVQDTIRKLCQFLFAAAVVFMCVAPLSYAFGGRDGLRLTLMYAILGVAHDLDRPSKNFDILELFTYGIGFAFAIGLVIPIVHGLELGFLCGFLTCTVAGTMLYLGLITWDDTAANQPPISFARFIKRILITVGAGVTLIILFGVKDPTWAFVLTVLKSPTLVFGAFCGSFFAHTVVRRGLFWLRPRYQVLRELGPYFRVMAAPLLVFVMVYAFIIVVFAGYYMAICRYHPSAQNFHGLNSHSTFGEFIYYSVVTVATLGFGDIYPESRITRTISSFEVIVGVGWLTIGFAAVLAYLNPRFAAIAKAAEDTKEAERDLQAKD